MDTDQIDGTTVHLPALGDSVEEGVITRWLKRPGDHVNRDEPLLEVSTDKVDNEIPSPVDGILEKTLADEGDVVACGALLAVITESSSESVATPAGQVRSSALESLEEDSSLADNTVLQVPGSVGVRSSSEDSTVAPPTGSTVEKLPRVRRTIAQRMVKSLQTSAQLTTVVEVDVTSIARLRNANKSAFHDRTGVKLSFFPFFAKAAVEALAEHRVLNASLNSDVTEATYHGACHLGIAVDSDKGLMVPVIRDAHLLSIEQLARAIADKAVRVRSGGISADELSGGTFTLTNTGSRGALFDTPIINQPQAGILGTGAVVERIVPARRDGELSVEVRSMAYLSISYDHRIVDGADAARFLTTVKKRLEGGFSVSDLV